MWWKKKRTETPRKPLGLYVHLPFCKRKCGYCDFLSAPADTQTQERYVEALIAEIRGYRELAGGYRVRTVYFGGGTPSLLPTELLRQIADAVRETFLVEEDAEWTIEVNPAVVTPPGSLCGDAGKTPGQAGQEDSFGGGMKGAPDAAFEAYRRMGFNRVSIGIQSADDKELALLGRLHTFEEAKQCFAAARKAGFSNLSVDLMSAIPGQTLESYQRTLEEVLVLSPEHLSSYSLMLEEGTPFYERYAEGKEQAGMLPDEETDRAMYRYTKERLERAGYHRYEISNYAKEGFESRHNSAYWTGTEYLGFGLGASSLFTNARYHNETDLTVYLRQMAAGEDVRRDMERMVESEAMEEFMILGLRMRKGISRKAFFERFHRQVETVYGTQLKKLESQGLLSVDGDTIALTEFGIDVSNQVFVEFVPEDFVRR